MAKILDVTPETDLELVLRRHIAAPRAAVFRCWTEPQLMKQWFCPKPWETPEIEVDLRAGGSNYILMRGPNGEEMPNRGVYLEVTPNERLVFTDAFTKAWEPSPNPFFTGIIELEDAPDGGTIYTARARHWDAAKMQQHKEMGFHEGWGICADQLEEVARTL